MEYCIKDNFKTVPSTSSAVCGADVKVTYRIGVSNGEDWDYTDFVEYCKPEVIVTKTTVEIGAEPLIQSMESPTHTGYVYLNGSDEAEYTIKNMDTNRGVIEAYPQIIGDDIDYDPEGSITEILIKIIER